MSSKNRSETAKTQFRRRLAHRLKKKPVLVFFGPGLVFFGPGPVLFGFRNIWTSLSLSLAFLGQKTGVDWTFEH